MKKKTTSHSLFSAHKNKLGFWFSYNVQKTNLKLLFSATKPKILVNNEFGQNNTLTNKFWIV